MNSWTPDTCSRLMEAAGDTLRPGGIELSKHLLGFGNFQTGSRILDAGCGMGATLRYLSQTCRLDAVGVDSSESMLTAARQQSPGLPLVCAALDKLPFGDASFDGIICECVLSQTSVRAVLAEFKRVLRVDGLLLLSDLYRRTACPNRTTEPAPNDRLATKEETEIILQEAGFTVEHWEDRSRDLQQLAIQLIMAPGSSSESLFDWTGRKCCSNGTETGTARRDLGYHLLVARRSA